MRLKTIRRFIKGTLTCAKVFLQFSAHFVRPSMRARSQRDYIECRFPDTNTIMVIVWIFIYNHVMWVQWASLKKTEKPQEFCLFCSKMVRWMEIQSPSMLCNDIPNMFAVLFSHIYCRCITVEFYIQGFGRLHHNSTGKLDIYLAFGLSKHVITRYIHTHTARPSIYGMTRQNWQYSAAS